MVGKPGGCIILAHSTGAIFSHSPKTPGEGQEEKQGGRRGTEKRKGKPGDKFPSEPVNCDSKARGRGSAKN